MKLILESTDDTTTSVRGAPTRKWIGHTESGIPVECYIAAVAVPEGLPAEDYARFEQELRQLPYRRDLVSFDLRMAMD